MTLRHPFSLLCSVFVALLTACAPQPVRETIGAASPGATLERTYAEFARRGEPVLEIDPSRSLIVLEVRRAGSLARLGHDHVVASHDVRGYVAPRLGRADLYVRLADLVVDEPELRAVARFDTQPSEAAVQGTRENMLHRVLDADAHPFVLVSVAGATTGQGDETLLATVTLNGVTRTMPVRIAIEPVTGELRVGGTLTIVQSEFGIVPLSIIGGAIQVDDPVRARFDLRARSPAR